MAAPATQEQNKAKEMEAAKEAKLEIRLVKNIEVDEDVFMAIDKISTDAVVELQPKYKYEEFLKREIKELQNYDLFDMFVGNQRDIVILARSSDGKDKIILANLFEKKIKFEKEINLYSKYFSKVRFYLTL
jgi:hypothetical protein